MQINANLKYKTGQKTIVRILDLGFREWDKNYLS